MALFERRGGDPARCGAPGDQSPYDDQGGQDGERERRDDPAGSGLQRIADQAFGSGAQGSRADVELLARGVAERRQDDQRGDSNEGDHEEH